MSEPVPTAPALGVSVQCAAGECQLVFQTHVAQDTDKATLDALVDRLTAVAARQKAKVDLVSVKVNLKVSERDLRRMREDRARVEADLAAPQEGRRNQHRNEADLKQKREQADATEKRYLEIIAEGKSEITALEAVIAGG